MFKIGIFGDAHITKNMRSLQNRWEESVISSFMNMYKKFDEEEVEFVVGLGDLLDTPEIKAKHLHLLRPVFQMMNLRSYHTYLLLGNHEIESDSSNILEYLSEYENIKPVTDSDIIREQFAFIPYSVDPKELDPEFMKDKYVFTHHDIYGSDLAGGKVKAFFGLDPDIFKEAKKVFNGHVHLKSKFAKNIINSGSLLVSQQGELKVGEYPSYYILDTETEAVTEYDNKFSMIYQAINMNEVSKVTQYDGDKLVLRVDYEGEIPEKFINTAHTSWRKMITSIESSNTDVIRTSNFDLKNYLIDYIDKDPNVTDKEAYKKIGLEVLS